MNGGAPIDFMKLERGASFVEKIVSLSLDMSLECMSLECHWDIWTAVPCRYLEISGKR